MEKAFPKLAECGGFELLRSCTKIELEVMTAPTAGYTSEYLADASNLGQAVCYIRPIQKNLDLKILVEEEDEQMKEQCLICGFMWRLLSYEFMWTLTLLDHQSDATCPVCQTAMPMGLLEVHTATCEETKQDTEGLETTAPCRVKRTLVEDLQTAELRIDVDTNWNLCVVRRRFTTFMDKLEESRASENCWYKNIMVRFIVEEGVDAGLGREFFSMILRKSPCFDEDSFSLISDLVVRKQYELLGKSVAYSVLVGHPGPRRFHPVIAEYILSEKEPDLSSLTNEDIKIRAVLDVVAEIGTASKDNLTNIAIKHSSLLESAGVLGQLNDRQHEAATALRGFYLIYQCLGAIRQFLEGFKLHGVLGILRQHLTESMALLVEGVCPAIEVIDFYKPLHSADAAETEVEENILYNLHQTLKKIQRHDITTDWIDPYDPDHPTKVVLSMSHVLQAAVGCPDIPGNFLKGEIHFDHTTKQ